jgi:hypothetical protein
MVFNAGGGSARVQPPSRCRRNEPSVAAAGNCLDGDAEPLAGLGQALASVAEIAERLRGKWVVEMGEIERLSQAEVETIKAFLSRSTDHYSLARRVSSGRVSLAKRSRHWTAA